MNFCEILEKYALDKKRLDFGVDFDLVLGSFQLF